jgi:hypothetical protein
VSDFYDEAEDTPRSRLGPIFVATFESDCDACMDLIVPGEDIRSDGRDGWIHADDSCEAIALGTDIETRATPVAMYHGLEDQ